MAAKRVVESKSPQPGPASGPPAPFKTIAAYVGTAAAILGGISAIIINSGSLYQRWVDWTTPYELAGIWCVLDEITGDPGTRYLGERTGFELHIRKGSPGYYAAAADSVAFKGHKALGSHLELDPWPVGVFPIKVRFTQTTVLSTRTATSKGAFTWERDGATLRGSIDPLNGDSTGRSTATRAQNGDCDTLILATAPDA